MKRIFFILCTWLLFFSGSPAKTVALTLYWIGNKSNEWKPSDPNGWAVTSGGVQTLDIGVPDNTTRCIFDGNSPDCKVMGTQDVGEVLFSGSGDFGGSGDYTAEFSSNDPSYVVNIKGISGETMLNLSPDMSFIFNGSIRCYGTGTVTSQAVTMPCNIEFDGSEDDTGISFQLDDNIAVDEIHKLILTAGTLDIQDHTITCGHFYAPSGGSRRYFINAGDYFYCTGNSNDAGLGSLPVWEMSDMETFDPPVEIHITDGGGDLKVFRGGDNIYSGIVIGDGGAGGADIQIYGNNSFTIFSITAAAMVVRFEHFTTTTITTSFTGSGSSGNEIQLKVIDEDDYYSMINSSGSPITLAYYDIRSLHASPTCPDPNSWFATNSIDDGGNDGVNFGITFCPVTAAAKALKGAGN